jgi:TatD DNase family protein
MLIDTHAHLQNERYKEEEIPTIIAEAKASGVAYIIVNGYDVASSLAAVKLAEKYPEIYAAVGIHPSDSKEVTDLDLVEIEKMLSHDKVVALGEIGLDYYWDTTFKEKMQDVFRKQIRIAKKT